MLLSYVIRRQKEASAPATINKELSIIRKAYNLAFEMSTIRRGDIPHFPMLPESNTRKGFLKDEDYNRLAEATMKEGLWLRAAFELAYNYGWRKAEIFGLTLDRLDFADRSIRLDDSKNSEGRIMFMTGKVGELLLACCHGKTGDDLVLTRGGQPIVDIRDAWVRATKAAGCPGFCSTTSGGRE